MSHTELSEKDSQINDLRANIKTQQSETSKAKSELKTALENIEQWKQSFSADKTGWETEKAALLKRAEDAEAALKPDWWVVRFKASDQQHDISHLR